MPTYEYECTKCGEVFELFQSITDRPKRSIKTDCKRCNNRAPVTRRISGGAGIIFKGSGFYQTDYRSEEYKKAAKADKESSDGKSGTDAAKPDRKGASKDDGGKSDKTGQSTKESKSPPGDKE